MRCLKILIALTISINFANASEPILGFESYGTVKFGSPILDVEKTLGGKGTRESGEAGCDYIKFKRYPKASFMVEDGIVTRADVEKGVPNTLKIPVGTSLADVKKKYPKVIVEQHKYDEEGHYLIFKNAKGTKAIVMEEGNGKVTEIRGGLEPSVEYVEGCL